MRDQYVVKWRNILDTDTRCEVYRIFKQEFNYEPYFKKLSGYKMFTMCKFRMGCFNMPAVRARMYLNEPEETTCALCGTQGKLDELHYFISCNGLRETRNRSFPNLKDLPQVFYIERFRNIRT